MCVGWCVDDCILELVLIIITESKDFIFNLLSY